MIPRSRNYQAFSSSLTPVHSVHLHTRHSQNTCMCVCVCVWACVRYLLCVFFGHPQWSTVIGCIPQLEAAIAAACHQNVLISFTPCHVEQAVTPLPAETHTRGWHKNLLFDPWLNSCFLYSTLKDYFWGVLMVLWSSRLQRGAMQLPTSLCVSVFPRCGVNNLRNGTLHTKISYLLNNHTCVIIQNADEEECDSYWFVYIICIFIIFWVFRPCHSLSGSQWQPHKTRGFYLVSSQSDNNLICAEIRWNRALNLLQLLIIIICKHKGQKQMLERERWGNRCYLLTKVSPVSVWSRTSSVPQPVHTQTEWMGMRKLTV